MNRIQDQAAKLWQTLSATDTVTTYKQAGVVTWNIVRELALLVWLVFCLVLVAIDWFWKNSIQAGRNFRYWLTNLDQSSPDRIASEAGRALLTVGKDSLDTTISKARTQLGLPLKLEMPEREPVAVAPKRPEPVQAQPMPEAPKSTVQPEPTVSKPEPTNLPLDDEE